MKNIGFFLSFLLLTAVFSFGVFAAEEKSSGTETPDVGFDPAEEIDVIEEGERRGTPAARAVAPVADFYTVRREGECFFLTDRDGTEIMQSGELQQLIDGAMAKAESVVFSFLSVSVDRSLNFSRGEIFLEGSLCFEGEAGLVLSDGGLTIEGDLLFSSGGIRIKEGFLHLTGGKIRSAGCAVTLDYSSAARFEMSGGEIVSMGEGAAVENRLGTVSVSGGSIRNTAGYAVRSEGTLKLGGDAILDGEGTDVAATLPVTLTAQGIPFAGTLSVNLRKTFEKGRETPAFYGAVSGMETRISLTDASGCAMPLVFREKGKNTDEKSFLAVSLPYRYSCLLDGEEVFVLYGLAGEELQAPDPPQKRGYAFDAWYTDRAMTEKMNFSSPPEKDTVLYAKTSLLPPTFAVHGLTFSFDGELHDLTFSRLSHELEESGMFSFAWYRDGVVCPSSAKCLKLRNVGDSGEYICKITFTNGADSVTVTTPAIRVSVTKKYIKIPEVQSKTYSGERQCASLFDTAEYTVSENAGGVSVGEYPVRLSVGDPENCAFFGTEETTLTLSFSIVRAENSFLGEIGIPDYFESGRAEPFARSRFGTPSFFYSDREDGTYGTIPPSIPGRYYLYAAVEGCADYAPLRSAPISFCVKEVRVLSLRVSVLPHKTSYLAFERFSPEGMCVLATYSDGTEREVATSDLVFTYAENAREFHVRAPYLLLSYAGVGVTLPLSVEAAEYPTGDVTLSDLTVTYDGERHIPTLAGKLPTGKDGSIPTAKIVGGGTDVGEYTVTVSFGSVGTDYRAPAPMTATLRILPKETTVVFSDTDFVYNGRIQCPTAWYTDVFGQKVALSVSGGKSEAGENYLAVAHPTDENYAFFGTTARFSVARAEYDLSGVLWSAKAFVYDGEKKQVTLSGLPDGVVAVGYADAEGIRAGVYTARACLSYDEKNYKEPILSPYSWEIKKAEYPVTYGFSDSEFIYDGAAHTPRMTGTLPIGADGFSPIPSFDRAVTHVAEGVCTVRISFSTKSENYFSPQDMTATVRITPCPATVTWENLSFSYTGAAHSPTAGSELFGVSVSGAGVDAGEYTAHAVSLSEDYFVENETAIFHVLSAENHWIKPLLQTEIYESEEFSATAVPFYGKSVIRFFSDKELKNEIEPPHTHGVYYMRAEVAASVNYRELIGESVPLTLLEVLPLSLCVTLSDEDRIAFSVLSPSDFSAGILYNDGSTEKIPSETVRVLYRHADGFRTSDDTVGFAYGSLTATVPVRVKKCVPDFSSVRLSEEEFFYDGKTHTVTFLGLPSGFSVLSYEGENLRSAGEYTVCATLSFDSENYDAPRVLSRRVRVLRAEVAVPTLPSAVYDGTPQFPQLPASPFYTATFEDNARHAGCYTVTLRLWDAENYRFVGSEEGETTEIFFLVLPRKLVYTLADVIRYRDGTLTQPVPTLTDGEILEGEDPLLHMEETADRFLLSAKNPDYTVETVGGEIRPTEKLSPATVRTIFFFVLLALLLLLSLLFLFSKREEIRCRVAWRAEKKKSRLPAGERASERATHAGMAKELLTEDARAAETEEKTEAETPLPSEDTPREEEKNDRKDDAAEEEKERAGTDAVGVATADALITDALARELLSSEETTVISAGSRRGVVNVDTLSRSFDGGDRVDINLLKEKTLIPYDTGYLKVLARGVIDKPLTVYADDFSLQAVKMIALTGGEAVRARTVSPKDKEKK